MFIDRGLDQLRGPVRCGQVQRHGGDAIEVVEAVRSPRSRHHAGALIHERLGHGQPDALPRSGNDGDLVSEFEIHHGSLQIGVSGFGTAANRRTVGDLTMGLDPSGR